MRTDYTIRNPGGTRGGTTAPAIFIKTSACASITFDLHNDMVEQAGHTHGRVTGYERGD